MGWLKKKFKGPKAAAKEPPPSTQQDSKLQSVQPPAAQLSPSSHPQSDQSKPTQPPAAQPLSPPASKDVQPLTVEPSIMQSPQSEPAQTAPDDRLAARVPGGAPLGIDATENAELTKIWLQVQEKVSQLAAREGKQVKNGLDVDDVIANLDASQEKKEESTTRKAVKTAFGRTMGLIKTVGGIVADGASTVFAPAGQCYNVISFLINAYDGYQGAFEGLADLLDSCSAHLGRLDYYVKAKMDARLSKVAAEQLSLFVDICDAALQLRYSAGHKFKTGMKIAFLQENDIQDLLGRMEKLATKERGLVSAQTFERACAAATSAEEGAAFSKRVVEMMVQNDADQKERVETEGQERTLKDVLAFDKHSDRWNSTNSEPLDLWQTEYNDIRKNVVPGTGKWLLSHTMFQSWVSDFTFSPILGLEGTSSTGKSYLTSSAIRYLQKDMATQSPDLRHVVAFFFLDRGESGQGFDVAAQSLIWQLSKKDVPYMKSASRISRTVKTLDPNEIIPKLLLENTELEHMDAVFYLVIDGVSDTPDDSLLKFLRQASKPSKKKIRVFLSGTPAAFAKIKKSGLSCYSIPISGNNNDDIQRFIEARMDKFEALCDAERPMVAERRKKIREDLFEATAGDYFKINSALNAIATLDYMEEINEVIQAAHQGHFGQISDEIRLLNRVRTPRQIREINQIILWVTFSIGPILEKHLLATLYMNIGEAPLQSLLARFQTKYLLFEVDSKGHVGFRSSEALNAIPHRRPAKKSDQRDNQEIQTGEINMIKHFLDKVCPPDVYKKLELDQYLQQKLTQKEDQIQQEDNDTGHLLLALDCLRALSKSRDTSVFALHEYAREHLIEHLASVDLAMVDRDQKSQVGELLVKLFSEDEHIDAFMWPETDDVVRTRKPRMTWVEESQNIDQVVRWFKDTAVVSSVTDERSRSWIKEVTSGNAFEALLKLSAARMTYHCFREPSSSEEVRDIYFFVDKYLSKVLGETEYENWEVANLERAARFERWAYEAIRLSGKDSLWHTQMAMLYENRMLSAEAVKRCDSVLHKDPANWRASFCRARNSELSEAIERLKAVISCQESDSLWMQDPTHKKDLAEMTYALAGKYRLLNNFELVIPTVALSLKQDPQRIDQAFDAMGWYWVNEKWEAILSLLEQVASFDNQEHLADMVVRYAKFVFFNQIIQQTVATTQQFGIVHTVYQAGIRKAKKQNDAKALFMFHYYYGNVLYGQPQRPEDQIIELWEAALKVDLPSSDFEVAGRLSQIYAGLGGLYLQRALVAKDNADPAAAEDSLRRLSDMVPEEVTQAQLPLPPQLYIARFHHVNGDHAKARETVRTLVQIALELLSDEDTKNDYQAFAKLLYIFIPLGDKKNTVAAWTLLALCTKAEHEADPDSSDDSDDDDDEPNYYLGLSCFGQCKHQWKVPSKIQICMNCIMVCLEDNCLKKLREGKLELNICHPSHDYLEVPEWDEGRMASLPKGEVPWENLPWGERNITLEEWKQEIRKEYIGLDA